MSENKRLIAETKTARPEDAVDFNDLANPSFAVHTLMKNEPHPSDAERLSKFVSACGSSFCLFSAASKGRLDMLQLLAEEHGADLLESKELLSAENPGEKTRFNLLSDALSTYAYSPFANRSAEGISRFNQTIAYLLQKGVQAHENPSPLESAVGDAFVLAQPESELVAHITWVPPMPGCKNPEPLALILKYQPEAVRALDQAFAEKSGKFVPNFRAAAKGELDAPALKRIADKIMRLPGLNKD